MLKKVSIWKITFTGLPCSVQLEDGTWRRGEIVDVINEDTVQVFCVDWGCKLILNRDCLRGIPNKYTLYKAQVSQSLFNIILDWKGVGQW